MPSSVKVEIVPLNKPREAQDPLGLGSSQKSSYFENCQRPSLDYINIEPCKKDLRSGKPEELNANLFLDYAKSMKA